MIARIGFASAGYGDALFSITNTGTKNQRVVIQKFDLMPLMASGVSGTPSTICPFKISYINGMSPAGAGGVPIVTTPMVPGTALPAQVRLEMLNPSVDLVANTVIARRILTQVCVTGGTFTGAEFLYGVTPPDNRLFSAGYRDANTTGLVLPEGYGVSVCQASMSTSGLDSLGASNFMFWATILLKDGSGNTFTAVCELVAGFRRQGPEVMSATQIYNILPPITVFNGAGSGTSIKILSINWNYAALDVGTSPNRFDGPRVQFLSTLGDSSNGEAITPMPANPQDTCSFLRIARARLGYPLSVKRRMSDEVQQNLGLNNLQYNPATTAWPNSLFAVLRSDGVYRMAHTHRPAANAFSPEAPTASRYGDRHRSATTQGYVIPPGAGFACVPEMESLRSFNIADNPNPYHVYWVDLVVNIPNDGAVGHAHA